MKQEVIQDFLNLPGIAAVALMDGRARPFFCGVDETQNFQQKEALAQGILRVVETIPEGFDTFEFQFTGHQVYIYKLEHGVVLLVLTDGGLIYTDFLKTIKDLKAVLDEDITNAIATFRLTAGNITLSTTNRSPTATSSIAPPPPSNTIDSPSASVSDQLAPDSSNGAAGFSPKDAITALNALSQFTTEYLGTHVIVNYWKTTRPEHSWLSHFEVDRSAQFSFNGAISSPQPDLTAAEQLALQEWVSAFVKRCSQVIRDFPALVEQKALEQNQKRLLLGLKE